MGKTNMSSSKKQNQNGDGLKKFQEAGNQVLKKIKELRDCKKSVNAAVLTLSDNSKKLTSGLRKLNKNVHKMDRRRKFLQTSGVVATTLGSSLAAVLWGIAYVNSEVEEDSAWYSSLAWLATGVGLAGTVVKMSTAYICSRSNQTYMKELDESISGDHGNNMNEAEQNLNTKFKELIQLFKELYGGHDSEDVRSDEHHHPLLRHRPAAARVSTGKEVEDEEEDAPLVMSIMETADSATAAPDVISTVLEYSSDLGLEPIEILEQTYDAATSSLGEIISFGILEGAANGLSLLVSSYEVYRLVNSLKRQNPTAQKIEELITNVEKKLKVYNNLKKCIEIVDTFKLRSISANKRSG